VIDGAGPGGLRQGGVGRGESERRPSAYHQRPRDRSRLSVRRDGERRQAGGGRSSRHDVAGVSYYAEVGAAIGFVRTEGSRALVSTYLRTFRSSVSIDQAALTDKDRKLVWKAPENQLSDSLDRNVRRPTAEQVPQKWSGRNPRAFASSREPTGGSTYPSPAASFRAGNRSRAPRHLPAAGRWSRGVTSTAYSGPARVGSTASLRRPGNLVAPGLRLVPRSAAICTPAGVKIP
jgi:hypothetical protein